MAKINLYSPLNVPHSVPDGLGVRIPGFHPGGPGSIPGLGAFLLYDFTDIQNHSINIHIILYAICSTYELYNSISS